MKLYNNIIIDESNFPPKDINNKDLKCLRVPYLEEKPDVINISVGRQLFVDNFLIKSTNLTSVEHRPTQYENNPIFAPETPWEKGEVTHYYEHVRPSSAILFSGGMWYDGTKNKFRMWYQAGFHGSMAYAESDDGIHFTKENYTVYGDTNIVLPRGGVWLDTNAVILNHYPENAEKNEYLMSIYVRPYEVERTGVYIYSSVDGIHWTFETLTGAKGFDEFNGCDDTSNISYNPFRKKWVYSVKHNCPPLWRARHYAEGDTLVDARDMENKVFWQKADERDIPDKETGLTPQLYVLNSIAYESVMLGAFDIWKGPENWDCIKAANPKITEIHLGFSRDGFNYSRQEDRTAFLGCSRDKSKWDNGYVHASNTICLIVGDELWFYYTAFKGDETLKGETDETNGMYAGGAVGIAKLRRDGFVSLSGSGFVETENLEFDGKYLFVNTNSENFTCEVCDENGNVISGFEKENCIAFSGDSCKQQLSWKDKKDLSELHNKIIRLKFYQTSGDFYAFWISKYETGESEGYLAGGEVGKTTLCDTKE